MCKSTNCIITHVTIYIVSVIIGDSLDSFVTNDKQFINPKVFIDVDIDVVSLSESSSQATTNSDDDDTESKHFKLYVGSPFEFIHFSSLKHFNIYNRRVYKLQSNKLMVGNVNDIMFDVWMVHGCCLTQTRVNRVYGQEDHVIEKWEPLICEIDS